MKDKWDKAINDGQTRKCPEWGERGQKDLECTHMKWPNTKCKIKWCYVCGIGVKDLDTKSGRPNIFDHNPDWKTNSKRCPMYLHEISKIDKRYKNNPEKALEFFHDLLILQEVRKFLERYSDSQFEEFCKRYPEVLQFKIDFEQARNGDLTLIKRKSK